MFKFGKLSISRKFDTIIVLTCSAALMTACVAFISYDLISYRASMMRELAIQAHIIGANSSAALEFGDDLTAHENLQALQAEPRIMGAYLFKNDGTRLAHYHRSDVTHLDLPPLPTGAFHHFGDGYLECFDAVSINGEKVGLVYIRYDLSAFYARIKRYLGIALLVLLISKLLAFLFSSRLKHYLTDPIRALAHTTKAVSQHKDYSVRASKHSEDEIGQLVDGFNEMLGEIQERDAALAEHRDHLESEVAARTTELQATNEALAQAKEDAETASRFKSALLNNMTHEFRTPIAGILGLVDVLQHEVGPDHQEFLHLIQQSGERLQDTLSSVLAMSSLESGTQQFSPITFNLYDAVATAAAPHQARAQQKGLPFALPPAALLPVHMDAHALKTILHNLLSNAVKFTEQGAIQVTISHDAQTVRISVSDTGMGIKAELLDDLFEPFKQGSIGLTRAFEGSGLGLTITRRLTTLMGGSVDVQSQLGQGSTFTVALPIGPVRPTRTPNAAETPTSPGAVIGSPVHPAGRPAGGWG